VSGTKVHAEALRDEIAEVLSALSIHGDLAGRVSERRKAPLTWENEGVEANILP
jgi:hypothetical protein